jgi:hypothetical protein
MNTRFSPAHDRRKTRRHIDIDTRSSSWDVAKSRSRKGRQPVTPTDGAGVVPAGGGSSLLLSGGPGIDPAGITTGVRGASLERDA